MGKTLITAPPVKIITTLTTISARIVTVPANPAVLVPPARAVPPPSDYFKLRYLYITSCVDSCPIGFYADSSSNSCIQCDSSCLTCTSKSTCSACPVLKLLYNGRCVAFCGDGFYPGQSGLTAATCLECNSNCNTCMD
jgi:hypothetical protein